MTYSDAYYRSLLAAAAVVTALSGAPTNAHDGRRFSIEVVDSQLQAQGLNTGPDDGAPAIRPYVNSLHDHWGNATTDSAVASLPGFDLPPSAATPLLDHRIDLEWLGVRRWVNPPMMPPAGTVPSLVPLSPDEFITISGPSGVLDSSELGIMPLLEQVVFGGVDDIDLVYEINSEPQGVIHVLEFRLVAVPLAGGTSLVQPSEPVHILLSPDGATPHERLHHAALFLEAHLAQVPETSTFTSAVIGVLGLSMRSRGPSGLAFRG